ncbi:hypothetical protein AB0J80_34835 [Actinoplanes sp. NPDC049548]|uniref:hypothetical protein n=1 Tax=Actinoplanes sp. NPDC049548 TaxID=3155152 RepID=UPI003415ABAA
MRSLRMLAFAVSSTLALSACGNSAPSTAGLADLAGNAASLAGAAFVTGTAKAAQASPGTGDWAARKGGTPTGDAAAVAQRWVQLTAARAGDLDPVLVNGAGLTLYRFDKDNANPSKATCNGDCAAKWPPVTVKPGGRIFIAGVARKKVGVVKRDDGRLQITVGGWPVYRFAQDTEPGDTKGQGIGDTWFGVRPDGGKAGVESPAEPPAEQASVPAKRVVLFDRRSFNVFDDTASSQVIEGRTGCVNATTPGTASSIAFDGLVKVWSGPDCTGESKQLGALDAENVGGIADLRDIGFDNRIGSVKL